MRIRLHVNGTKPKAAAAAAALKATARRLGLEVVGAGAADAVVALGGDGTILHAIHTYPGMPVLGLNLGGLGYLAGVGERDFTRALEMLASGRCRISERSMLAVRKAGAGKTFTALNEAAVMRGMTGHAAVLDLAVDGRVATRYLGDGLVVATPTGSTAYSLSAGGPVLMPDTASFVITPMNPHALGVRPMVVRDTVTLTVTARRRADAADETIGVYADGVAAFTLADGETAEVFKAPQGAAMVELEGYDPCEVLARKLGWSGANRGVS